MSLATALATVPQIWIDTHRSLLSMRETEATGSVYKLSNTLGNEEFREDVMLGLSFFNMYPPYTTHYNFNSLPDEFIDPVLLCCQFQTGLRLQWFEAGAHFTYNDNGIVMDRRKQQEYQNVGSGILQWISSSLNPLKRVVALDSLHVAGQFSSSISFPRSLTRGLRGTRLGSSVQ